MNLLREEQSTRRGPAFVWVSLLFGGVILAAASYVHRVPENPHGFYLDESSIAYNSYTISRTGRDEYGVAWPLYFTAFGEFKNPVHIYLLAALFKLFGPSILVARLLSAVLGVVAAALLWLLSVRLTGRRAVGHVIAISALLTPWLFENSRPVFEVALYPALVALFLMTLQRASEKQRWGPFDAVSLTATLALLTYSSSIGRLLGPLLAAGLAIFLTRERLRGVIITWLGYVLTLVPLLWFNWRHPGALLSRFWLLTYIKPQLSTSDIILEFSRRYLTNISPWRLAVTGEVNIRDHIGSMGSILAPTVILGILGLVVLLRYCRRDAWWRYIVYALAMSVVPASLTVTEFPQIRLIAFPIIFHVLAIPGVSWLLFGAITFARWGCSTTGPLPGARSRWNAKGRLPVFGLLLALMLIQGIFFRWEFHREELSRGYVFDEQYPREVFPAALALNKKPIYLYDPPGKSGYIQAYWYGVLEGMDASHFVRLPIDAAPPEGAVVISTEPYCSNCRLVLKSINYIVYVAGTDPGR